MIKILLSSVIFASQAFAGLPPTTVKGQVESTKTTTFNLEAPYNQATTTAAVTRLLETGNENLLLNANFEATTATSNWTFQSGASAAVETTEVKSGKKSLLVTLTSVNGLAVSQDVTPTIKLEGSNIESGVWIKTSLTTLQVCTRRATATYGQCATVQGDNVWRYYQAFQAGPSSGSVGVSVITTGSTSGTFYMDNGYTGLANLGQGTPPNEFSFVNDSSGAITSLTGNVVVGAGSITSDSQNRYITFPVTGLSSTPNCVPSADGGAGGGSCTYYKGISSSNSIVIACSTNSATPQTSGTTVKCTKTGSDFVQNAVSAPNWNFSDRTYSTTLTGLGTGSATVSRSTFSRSGAKGTVCIDATKDGSGGTGGTAVEASLPSGITVNSSYGSAVWVGSGFSTINSNNFTTFVDSTNNKVRFTLGSAVLSGSAWTASSNINGCVTFPVAENGVPWTETYNAPQLLGSVTSKKLSSINDIEGRIGGATDGANCTGTCTVYDAPSGITATRNATGSYTLNTPSGTCQTALKCSFEGVSAGVIPVLCGKGGASSTTAYPLSCYQPGSSTPLDSLIDFRCTCGL